MIMDKPIQIAIKYTAAGIVAFLVAALIGKSLFGSTGSFVAVAVAVFVTMLFAATRAAHEQKKKDAEGDRQDK